MDQSSRPQSFNPVAVAIVVILFLSPPTSQAMIALVIFGIPATLIVWVTGMVLGRIPMLLVAGFSGVLILSTMVRLLFTPW